MVYIRKNLRCQYPGCGEPLPPNCKVWCYSHNTVVKRLALTPMPKCREAGCTEDVAQRNRRYCDRHGCPDRLHTLAQGRYYAKHRERYKVYMKKWRERNPNYHKERGK